MSENYYATFMQKQATKNHYVLINAPDESTARAAMFAHFGDKFMTVYSEEKFEGQIENFKLKLLLAIAVIDHGHDSIEYYLIG